MSTPPLPRAAATARRGVPDQAPRFVIPRFAGVCESHGSQGSGGSEEAADLDWMENGAVGLLRRRVVPPTGDVRPSQFLVSDVAQLDIEEDFSERPQIMELPVDPELVYGQEFCFPSSEIFYPKIHPLTEGPQNMEFPIDPELIYGQEFCFPRSVIYYPNPYVPAGTDTWMYERHGKLGCNSENLYYSEEQVDGSSSMIYVVPDYGITNPPYGSQHFDPLAGRLAGALALPTEAVDDTSYTGHSSMFTSSLSMEHQTVLPKVNVTHSIGSDPCNMSAERLQCLKQNKNDDRKFGFARKNTGKSKRTAGLLPPEIIVKSHTSRLHIGDPEGRIIIRTDQYNRDEFQAVYPSARFFVIKPLDKADIHKSIKYGVWSASCAGNRKLDCAFKEAKELASNSTLCPVFLIFSVSGSSIFSGVAEMLGTSDIQKNMDFWYSDRYVGYFPVKWHIIKDVPNSCLQGILLPSKKSVTTCRDVDEIPYDCGTNMLNILKYTRPVRSILHEFLVHEENEPKRISQNKFKLRQGAQHFVHSCNGDKIAKSRNIMMYRAITETKNLTDGMCQGSGDITIQASTASNEGKAICGYPDYSELGESYPKPRAPYVDIG